MIPRYSRKILKEIWEDNNKFQIWLDLEILACEAMEKLGQIPKGTSNRIKKKGKFKVKYNNELLSDINIYIGLQKALNN